MRSLEAVLGRTGLKIKTLGFGGIPIQRVSEEEAIRVVRRCYELGINFFDTARAYTVSEERIGKALEDVRDRVYLATKSARRDGEGLLEELEVSLRNLRTEYVDLYQLHNISRREQWEQVQAPGGALEAARQALEEGKIRHLGVTSHNPRLALELVESGHFETLMIPFNYLTPEPAERLLPRCKELGVGTIAMKPFGGGALSNASTALKHVLLNPYVDVVIPGVMSVEEVEENYRVWSGDHALQPGELESIERDRAELGDSFCRACDYCQPCPQGIPISFLLRAEKQMLRRMGWSEERAQRVAEALKLGETCIKCGQCEERCPYGLKIRELLPPTMASLRVHLENRTIP